jgi:Domain of unknown function (DUF3291)
VTQSEWHLAQAGDATAVRPYDDERILINLSVWADLDALRGYVFRSLHAAVMRRRWEWFERFEGISTPHAFTFAQPFDQEGKPILREWVPRDDTCPAT